MIITLNEITKGLDEFMEAHFIMAYETWNYNVATTLEKAAFQIPVAEEQWWQKNIFYWEIPPEIYSCLLWKIKWWIDMVFNLNQEGCYMLLFKNRKIGRGMFVYKLDSEETLIKSVRFWHQSYFSSFESTELQRIQNRFGVT